MKKRNGNGQGSVFNVIRKVKRKNGFLKEECSICKSCKNKCNRELFEKCDKCIDCKEECLKYCDRFYCYSHYDAQVTINGKQTTIASSKRQKETTNKKLQVESQIHTKDYVKKNGIKLEQKIIKLYDNKLNSKIIKENSYRRMLADLKHIQVSMINEISMQKITSNMIQDFINSKTYLCQRTIDGILQLLKTAFNQAIIDKEISFADNPMLDVIVPISERKQEFVKAFEVSEEIDLINYIKNNTQLLLTSSVTKYDCTSIKNMILLALYTGMRIGEIGALDYNKHIDFSKRIITVERTLSKDKNDKIIMGETSKTGLIKKRQHKSDIRMLPFEIFDDTTIENILKEQIEIAKKNPNNNEHLLFCKKDGFYIDHKQMSTIFKKICRDAGVKLDLPKGCHFHMTRHTFATRCIESGMDLLLLARLLGHVDTKQIEKTYGHILNNYMNENLLKLQKYYIKKNILSNKDSFNENIEITIPKELFNIIENLKEANIEELSYREIMNMLNIFKKKIVI